MSRVLARVAITDRVLAELRAVDFPIGDAAAPPLPDAAKPEYGTKRFGWHGQPGAPGSEFTPYAVLFPEAATAFSGPMAGPQEDVRLPYRFTVTGINRRQVELLADRLRIGLEDLKNERITHRPGQTLKVQQVEVMMVGEIVRNDASDPPTYAETDRVVVWLTP